MLNDEKMFEIQFNREDFIDRDESDIRQSDLYVMYNYNRAAFAGQKLFEVAATFSYWVPPLYSLLPFKFFVEIADLEKFVGVLHYIIQGVCNREEQEWETSFENQAVVFCDTAWQWKFEVGCWGLVYIADEYRTKVYGPAK